MTFTNADSYEAGRSDGFSQSKWRDFSSAPKDGTNILAYAPKRRMNIIYWSFTRGRWCCIARSDDKMIVEPTHFQPLPAPPVIGEKDGL